MKYLTAYHEARKQIALRGLTPGANARAVIKQVFELMHRQTTGSPQTDWIEVEKWLAGDAELLAPRKTFRPLNLGGWRRQYGEVIARIEEIQRMPSRG